MAQIIASIKKKYLTIILGGHFISLVFGGANLVSLNLRMIIPLALTTLFFPFYKDHLAKTLKKSFYLSIGYYLIVISYLYNILNFSLYPHLLPEKINIFKYIIISTKLFVYISFFISTINKNSQSSFKLYSMAIHKLAIFLSIEAIFVALLFKFPEYQAPFQTVQSRFGSFFIFHNALTGMIGFYALNTQIVRNLQNPFKISNIFFISLFIFLIIMTLERSIFLGVAVYSVATFTYIFFQSKHPKTIKALIATLFLLISIITVTSYSNLLSSYSNRKFFSSSTLKARVIHYAWTLDVLLNHYPMGTGGSANAYFSLSPKKITPMLNKLVETNKGTYNKPLLYDFEYSLPLFIKNIKLRNSIITSHSTYIDLLTDFGLSGILMILILLLLPFTYLLFQKEKTQEGIISSFYLIGIIFPINLLSYDQHIFFVFIIYAHFSCFHKNNNGALT